MLQTGLMGRTNGGGVLLVSLARYRGRWGSPRGWLLGSQPGDSTSWGYGVGGQNGRPRRGLLLGRRHGRGAGEVL